VKSKVDGFLRKGARRKSEKKKKGVIFHAFLTPHALTKFWSRLAFFLLSDHFDKTFEPSTLHFSQHLFLFQYVPLQSN
jgi:hypothetical protein